MRRSDTLAAAAAVVLALAAGMVATSREARKAEQEARRAEEVVELLTTLLEDADPDRSQDREVTVREVLDRAARSLDLELGSQPRLQASLQAVIGRVYAQLALVEQAGVQLGAALER